MDIKIVMKQNWGQLKNDKKYKHMAKINLGYHKYHILKKKVNSFQIL